MADTDVLDMWFDSHSSQDILGLGTGLNTKHGLEMEHTQQCTSNLTTTPAMTLGENDIDWTSLLANSGFDLQDDLLNLKDVMDVNLPDDIKEKQLQQPKRNSDHAYSATPGSPHSDSGISNGPSSPSSSSNSFDDVIPLDLEQQLFGPLNLKEYESPQIPDIDPMILDSWSDSSSCSPGMRNDGDDDTMMTFDFGDLVEQNSAQPVSDLTISTDENTKVIKVLSVNNNRRSQSLLNTKQQMQTKSVSSYPELTLSDEEKNLLMKEGISLPTHLPLTREEEKILRSVRRRIRNKASARNSRRKKQDYMEALEERVKMCTEERRKLEKKVNALEKQNSSLIGQLRKLQKMVSESTKQTAKTGTCAMILALSFALVLLPNFQSFIGGGGSGEDSLMKSSAGGRPSRSLLSKPEDIINTDSHEDTTANYLPFFNLNKMVSLVSPTKQMVAEPHDGLDGPYIHDSVEESHAPSDGISDDSKVIHMEITKLPESSLTGKPGLASGAENTSRLDVKPLHPEPSVRHRAIRMDVDDEL